MEKELYPGLYRASNEASLTAQKAYITNVRWYLILTIVGTISNYFISESTSSGIIAIFIFLSTLALIIYQARRRFDKDWYNGRALAESIKTRTWRFIMRAEPYQETNLEVVKHEYCKDLNDIFNQNKQLGKALLNEGILDDYITIGMLNIRNLPLEERLDFYIKNRIKEQRDWYYKKAKYNKRMERNWFIALVVFHVIILALLLMQVGYKIQKLPTEIIIVVVGSVLTWIQVKKYQDLSTSYTLTAHEISIINSQSFLAKGSEANLSNYVKDAENAFSREHTQWVARKDN